MRTLDEAQRLSRMRPPKLHNPVRLPRESVHHAAGLLLGFDSEIEVQSPETSRRELTLRARRVIAMYT